MKRTSYLILIVLSILFGTNTYLAQSKYQEMRKQGFSQKLLMDAGIYPDSSDFKNKKPDFLDNEIEEKLKVNNYDTSKKTLEEVAAERGMEWLQRSMEREDKNAQMTPYTFDTKATNYERFRNSPCFDKIGFNPLNLKTPEDVKALEEIYNDCEYHYTLSKIWKGTFFGAFILVLLATIYFGIGKDKIKNIFSKKSSTVINEME